MILEKNLHEKTLAVEVHLWHWRNKKMKICPKCDAQNANNAPVCKNCGANLNVTPDVKPAEYAEEKPTYHLGLALLFFFLSFIVSSVKMLIPENIDYPDYSEPWVYLYYAAIVAGVVFLILGFVCMRGLLKAKPIPGKGIFVIMVSIIVSCLILMDVFSVGQSLILGDNEAEISRQMETLEDSF